MEIQEKKDRGIAKWICFLLAGLAGVTFLFSIVCAVYFTEEDFYTVSKEKKLEQLYENYSNRYSAYVMQNLGTGENEEYFADKNFRYGVIQTNDYNEIKKLDLNSKSSYVETNFGSKNISLDDLHVFECNLSNETYFTSRNFESLNGYIYLSDNGRISSTHYEISQYVYDKDNGIFYAYVRGNNTYYRIDYLTLSINYQVIDANGEGISGSIEKYYGYNELTGKYQPFNRAFPKNQMILAFPDIDLGVAYGEEQINEVTALLSNVDFTFNMLDDTWLGYSNWLRYGLECQFITYESDDMDVTYMENGDVYTITVYGDEPYGAQLVIGSLPDEERCTITGMEDCNWIPETNTIVDWYKDASTENSKHYFVLSYVQNPLTNPGVWKKGDLYVKAFYFLDRVYAFSESWVYIVMGASFLVGLFCTIFVLVKAKKKHWFNKIPLELFWTGSGILFGIIFSMFYFSLEEINDFTGSIWIIIMTVSVFADILLAFGVLIDFVIRVKAGEWWKNTVCYLIYQFCKKQADKIALIFVEGNHLAVKYIGVYLVVVTIETILLRMIAGTLYGDEIVFWLLWKLAVGVLVYKWLMKWKEIKDSEIQEAVTERVKSERFQTELITNVSHDIKTPLTSVISYVDLLKKEDIQNEQASEYIEVLDRQSVRLKKLIEDLIEASKASTGNLPVHLEQLDAKVFLVQTIGEFEEKINGLGLEMIIKKPEEPVMISADGRHLWRVIDNLMNNICKYAQPSTRVYIDLVQEADSIQIIFKNTSKAALNISSEELMRRFVRGDTSRNTEGSGLGLSIAQNLMELMGGKLQLIVDGDLFKVILVFKKL